MIKFVCKRLSRKYVQRRITQCGSFKILLSHFFLQKFRKNNFSVRVTKEVTEELISRNIFQMRVNFSFFHTVYRRVLSYFHRRGSRCS